MVAQVPRTSVSRPSRFTAFLAVIGLVAASALVPLTPVKALTAGSAPLPIMGANPFGYNGLQRYSNATTLCTTTQYGLGPCQTPENTASLKAQALALVRPFRTDGRSLAGLGYDVLQLDNIWQGPRVCGKDQHVCNPSVDGLFNGVITPNPINYGSPSDFAALISWIRSLCDPVDRTKCLKVGIYDDWGHAIGFCNSHQPYTDSNNGLWYHEAADAKTFHSWGISYVKIDYICGAFYDEGQNYVDVRSGLPFHPTTGSTEFNYIRDAFAGYDNTSNPLVADIYWYGVTNTWSNIWRLGGDECGCYTDPDNTLWSTINQLDVADTSTNPAPDDVIGPINGQWNDMDNLLVAGTAGMGGSSAPPYLTPLEQRTQFGLEALNASILEIGSDVRNVAGCDYPADITCNPSSDWPACTGSMAGNQCPDARAIQDFVSNGAAIAIDQDNLGDMSRVVAYDQIRLGTCASTLPVGHPFGCWQLRSKLMSAPGTRAVGLLNNGGSAQSSIALPFNILRKDGEHEADGTTPMGGLHSVTHVYYIWPYGGQGTGMLVDLVNSSGTISIGTTYAGDGQLTISYSCGATSCTFGSAIQPVPAHALILLQIQGTSD